MARQKVFSQAQKEVINRLEEHKGAEVRKYVGHSGGGVCVAVYGEEGQVFKFPFTLGTFTALKDSRCLVRVGGSFKDGAMARYERYLLAGIIKTPVEASAPGVPQYYRCRSCQTVCIHYALLGSNGGCIECGGEVEPLTAIECRRIEDEKPESFEMAGAKRIVERVDGAARSEAIKDTLARLQHVRCELLRIARDAKETWGMDEKTERALTGSDGAWGTLLNLSDEMSAETGIGLEKGDERRHTWYTTRLTFRLPHKQRWNEMTEAERAEFVRRFNEAQGEDNYYAVVGDIDNGKEMREMEQYVPFVVFIAEDGRLGLRPDSSGIDAPDVVLPDDVTVSYEQR